MFRVTPWFRIVRSDIEIIRCVYKDSVARREHIDKMALGRCFSHLTTRSGYTKVSSSQGRKQNGKLAVKIAGVLKRVLSRNLSLLIYH